MENQTEKPAEEETAVPDNRPKPDDFVKYLPWACNQLQLDCTVVINKVHQNEYVSISPADRNKKTRMKQTQSRYEIASDHDQEEKSDTSLPQLLDYKLVMINATYDNNENLVELKFTRNKHIPRAVMEIIGLIITFQTYITRITINGGMNMYTVYELNKISQKTHITEICLDGSLVKEANYDILLEKANILRYLSLSRCKINDTVVENIASKLNFPSPASKCLTILILSSNIISDKGAKCLAQALKTNRQLAYLSLADNRITDDGAGFILDALKIFPLASEELIAARYRHMHYLKEKSAMVSEVVKELKVSEFDRRAAKRKFIRPMTTVSPGKRGKLDKEVSLKSIPNTQSTAYMDYYLYDKAEVIVEDRLGEFNDPYSGSNTEVRDGVMYCTGNYSLCYLNVAYNSLTYTSVKKLLNVLIYQRMLDRKPKGLVNVSIEGNNLPVSCKELIQVEEILESGFLVHTRRSSTMKKRPVKNTPR